MLSLYQHRSPQKGTIRLVVCRFCKLFLLVGNCNLIVNHGNAIFITDLDKLMVVKFYSFQWVISQIGFSL